MKKHRIETVIDVRHFPESKRMPWFKREYLELMLPKYRMKYEWLGKELGGYRKEGFDNYAKGKDFAQGVSRLADAALITKAAVLCAEAVPSRCHRNKIADSLVADGWVVNHILDESRVERHS